MRWSRAVTFYRGAALMTFNTIVLFVLLNLGLLLWPGGSKPRVPTAPAAGSSGPAAPDSGMPRDNGRRTPHQLRYTDLRAYAGVPANQVETALDDFYDLTQKGFEPDPWVQFGESDFDGKLVHVEVDTNGFRRRRTVPREDSPDGGRKLKVFVFGGSTTFGYNVADRWTFSSYLEGVLAESLAGTGLRPRVTNWGHGYFYSSQEVALFATLLRKGYRPDIAFFMDGLNEVGILAMMGDVPYFTPKNVELWKRAQFEAPRPTALDVLKSLPLFELPKRLGLSAPPASASAAPRAAAPPPLDAANLAEQALANYQGNVRVARALCHEFGVRCAFFWQPIPFFEYDMTLHRTPVKASAELLEAYRLTWERVQQIPDPPVFLGHLIREFGPGRHVFVDDCHYGPAFNRFLAQRMADATTPLWKPLTPPRPGLTLTP